MKKTAVVCLLFAAAWNPAWCLDEDATGFYTVKAGRIHLGNGNTLVDGIVIVRDGLIEVVGTNLKIPEGAKVLSCGPEAELTPGLIDAASRAGIIRPDSWADHSSELIPQMRNLDAVDLDAKTLRRLAVRGVTTVYVTPDPASVIGSRGTVVKTAGPRSMRVLKRESDVKVTMGPEGWVRGVYNQRPWGRTTFLTRRPTTRMGMAWVFRKAFYDAVAYRANRKESPQADHDPVMEVLADVVQGDIPLRIQAREDIDIWSAIRLAKEFGLKFTLEEGTEAYRCIPELKEYGVPVIFGPIFLVPRGSRTRSGEQLRPCLNSAGLLAEAGISLALTAGDLGEEDSLPQQACYAIRHGLSFQDALKATTETPAGMLGVKDRVGRIRPGLDGDLVLWTGRPFSPSTKPALVMINGEVVYQDERTLKK